MICPWCQKECKQGFVTASHFGVRWQRQGYPWYRRILTIFDTFLGHSLAADRCDYCRKIIMDISEKEPLKNTDGRCPNCSAVFDLSDDTGIDELKSSGWEKFCKNCGAKLDLDS